MIILEKEGLSSALPPLPESLKKHKFKIKEKVLSIGNKYIIEDEGGNLVGFCKQKILKMKEDIRIYKSKAMKKELFRIKQKNILDFSGTFEVIDSKTDETVGYLKRKGFKSMVKDEWVLLDPDKRKLGRGGYGEFLHIGSDETPGVRLYPIQI